MGLDPSREAAAGQPGWPTTAHPGLVQCEANVYVMLVESYQDMQNVGQ